MMNLNKRLDLIEPKILEPGFRAGRGTANEINFWIFEYDPEDELTVRAHVELKNGQAVDLTVKEFDLLAELIRNKNVALYRDRLYEKVWNEIFTGETRTLDSHIQRLRKKLGWEEYIKTVFRIGYRLEG